MKLTCEDQEQFSVLHLKGEFADDDGEKLRQAVRERLDAGTVHDIVLDMAELQFIDSQGLEAMLWVQENCTEKLGQLRLAACPENITTILQLTRLADQFARHDDVEAAIRSLA
ncbi:STAS domain-containing protein [Phycisphaerales bacterium AB-hyl4]|uniref:Anti-sigma factor antagonist n=1 Tax=Natronomicrosphaera hydrolytica TaxID=3242702 RepID=A0ABV4U1Y5_9BACT